MRANVAVTVYLQSRALSNGATHAPPELGDEQKASRGVVAIIIAQPSQSCPLNLGSLKLSPTADYLPS